MGKEDILCSMVLVIFVVLGALTAMHMLIGVLAHSVLTMAEREIEKTDVKRVKDAVVQLLVQLDIDQNGTVSYGEMQTMAQNKEACIALTDVHVNAEALVYFSNTIFQERESLTYEEVCELCLELREEQPARVKHILEMRKFLMGEFEKFEYQMREVMLAILTLRNHDDLTDKCRMGGVAEHRVPTSLATSTS